LKKLQKKWNDKSDSISMSDTVEPYFVKEEIRDFIKDIEE